MANMRSEIIRKLMDAKKFFLDGYINEGIKIVMEVTKSASKNEYNWLICNIIDSADCKNLFQILDKIGSYFDIDKCQNVKSIIDCAIDVNMLNEYVSKALEILVAQGKKDKLIEIAHKLLKTDNVSTALIVEVANTLRKASLEKEAVELYSQACRKGNSGACQSINAITVRSVM